MKLGGLEQCATIFVAETISGQHEHAEYTKECLEEHSMNRYVCYQRVNCASIVVYTGPKICM